MPASTLACCARSGTATATPAPSRLRTISPLSQTLREELEGFLADNGVFRDMAFYIDLLCAHIYAGYINDKGGQYLRGDFCGQAKEDSMAHTRRLLGLDAVDTETGRTRLKLIDGVAHVLGEPRRLSS